MRSERAFDLYMKARYLGQQHPGHGVTFATGTPISNTMVEAYNVQRFLDPEGLKAIIVSLRNARNELVRKRAGASANV